MKNEAARALSLPAKLSFAAVSLVFSLIVAELGFSAWYRGAFPYLNIYRNDPRYGVSLEPSARVRVRSRGGRVTEIATNARGFRGPEWPLPASRSSEPGRMRVLLLGDSQMLGYNVAEEEATAARLAEAAGAVVLDAAVPSWGPIEYALAVEELAPEYRPDVVIFVANLANDWVESNVPNTKRNVAADGWIERMRSDAPVRLEFPGRAFLLGRSFLVFGARELAALSRPVAGDHLGGATAAEQLLRDLVPLSRGRNGFRSRVTPYLARVVATCARLGCRVIAAGLPLDVQVDAREWAKYRGAPRDASAALVLIDRFLEDARGLDVAAIDLLPVLRDVSPGAFLPDDVHLSPRGHEAVARAFAEQIRVRSARAEGSR